MTRATLKKTKRSVDSRSAGLDKYSGKWVAFIDEKVIAWADTLEEVAKKIERLNLKERAVYFLVPRKDEGPYILIEVKKDV